MFAFKFYPSSCIYSLYKKIGGHPITFATYATLTHHHFAHNPPNPAIRLARSDTEFEENARNEQKVTFTEDLQNASMSEPNLSPQNIQKHEASILKPCFRKNNLQLPVNSSYP